MQQQLLDHLAPAPRLNEAQAFLSALNTAGAAVHTRCRHHDRHSGTASAFGGAALGAPLKGRFGDAMTSDLVSDPTRLNCQAASQSPWS
jgi:hypothetical protein